MVPEFAVVIEAGFLRLPPILAALQTVQYQDVPAKKDIVAVSQEIEQSEWYVLWCSLENRDHFFGPDLVIRGEGEPIRMTVPWNKIIGIVQTNEPFLFPMGFRPH